MADGYMPNLKIHQRQLVAALERQTNLFDGRDLQIGLGWVVMAHGGRQPRMLQVQTPNSL
jgi:hypothetical protein